MTIKKFASIIIILTLFYLLVPFFRVKTGKFVPPLIEMDNPDYIPGIININVTEDTWVGNGLLPGGCQSDPCDNGEKFCEKSCNFIHRGCYDAGGNYGPYIYVGKGSGTSASGTCGIYDNERHAYLWFNLSDARTINGNYLSIPWYLIKDATIKLWTVTATNCQNISLRNVLPDDNKNTVNETIYNLVYNSHYYPSGDYYAENSTFFGSEIQAACPTVNTTSEWNITNYVINQTNYGNDVFVQLKALGTFIPGGWSVTFSSKENTNETQRPYLQIELNSAVCGDGYCTPLNETISNCPQDCTLNYIEVNGTTFIQSEIINITGWSDNSSSYTYLWNNYTGTIQSMSPNGTGVQTNITSSSNLNTGVYNVYCNSTWNSTLISKNFTIVTITTTTVPATVIPISGGGGGGGGISIKNITTTSTTTTITTTSTVITSTIQTTTTILTKTSLNILNKKTPIWIFMLAIVVVVIIIAIFYVIGRREKYTVTEVKLDDFGYDYG